MIVFRKENKNVVIIFEEEYIELVKAKKNEIISQLLNLAKDVIIVDKSISILIWKRNIRRKIL